MNALLYRLGIEGPKSSFEARLADLTKASGRKFPNTQPEPKVKGSLPLIRGFWLKNALQESSSLMTTSDTEAIKIHRKSAATEEKQIISFDLDAAGNGDVWLQDGDVIEVPRMKLPPPKVEAARSTEGNQKPVGREPPRAHFRIPKG